MLTFKKLGRYGRFGNILFQIAGTIGIAMKNNHSFAFPKLINWDHLERFGSKEPIDLTDYFKNPLPEMPDINFEEMFIHWGYHNIIIPPDRAISLEGHMQSPRYFNHCIDIVRHYLRMKDEKQNNHLEQGCKHWERKRRTPGRPIVGQNAADEGSGGDALRNDASVF